MQAHQGHAVGAGELLRIDALAQAGFVGRAAPEGEVLAADHAAAPVDRAEAEHEVGRREVDEPPFVVAGCIARGAAQLLKGAVVEHGVDPFADRQQPPGVLAGDAFLAALRLGERALLRELVDLLLPAHTGLTRAQATTPASCSAAISLAESPASASSSPVCSPSMGAPRRIALGVASKRAAGRAWRILPATG